MNSSGCVAHLVLVLILSRYFPAVLPHIVVPILAMLIISFCLLKLLSVGEQWFPESSPCLNWLKWWISWLEIARILAVVGVILHYVFQQVLAKSRYHQQQQHQQQQQTDNPIVQHERQRHQQRDNPMSPGQYQHQRRRHQHTTTSPRTTRLPLEECVANENLHTCPISVLRKMVKNRNATMSENLLLKKSDLVQMKLQERRNFRITCSICFENFE